MRSLPVSVKRVIGQGDGFWSEHAAADADRLQLTWDDVVSVADTAESVKRERDSTAVDGYRYAVVGRDTGDSRIYMAGKVVIYDDERYWRVITIHEAS